MYTRILLALGILLAATTAVAETREVDNFNRVAYGLSFDIEFVASDKTYVELEGDQDTIDEVVTKVSGDTLKISKDSGWFDWSDKDIHITVGYVELNGIAMAGSGDGYAEEIETEDLELKISGSAALEVDSLNCNDLTTGISGSGNININELDADTLTSKISGSGDMDFTGKVVTQEVSISGSGDYSAAELHSQEADVSIRGSGDVEVWATASLNAAILGSGDIDYYGDPTLSQSIRGSGDLERRGDEP